MGYRRAGKMEKQEEDLLPEISVFTIGEQLIEELKEHLPDVQMEPDSPLIKLFCCV